MATCIYIEGPEAIVHDMARMLEKGHWWGLAGKAPVRGSDFAWWGAWHRHACRICGGFFEMVLCWGQAAEQPRTDSCQSTSAERYPGSWAGPALVGMTGVPGGFESLQEWCELERLLCRAEERLRTSQDHAERVLASLVQALQLTALPDVEDPQHAGAVPAEIGQVGAPAVLLP